MLIHFTIWTKWFSYISYLLIIIFLLLQFKNLISKEQMNNHKHIPVNHLYLAYNL